MLTVPKMFRYKHTGPVVDYFGTYIKKGDRIMKKQSWNWKRGRPHWFYVVDVQADHIVACRIFNFRDDGSLSHKAGQFGAPRKHTNINPTRIFIDHKWREAHV